MTSTFITATSVAAGIRTQLAAAGDQVVVIQGVTYGSTDERVIYGASGNHSAIIEGSVISGAQGALEFYIGNNEVTIGAAGSVRSSGTLGGYSNLTLFGANSTLWNQGTISSGAGIAAMLFGSSNSTVVNSGTITGAEIGLYLYNGNSVNVVNSGTIEGGTVGGFGQRGGIVALSAEAILIDNSGVIRANGFGANAIDLSGETGVFGPSLIHNTGTIISLDGVGILYNSSGIDNTVRVENYGLISGAATAIYASHAANVVLNAGTIDGDVILSGGADLYDGIGGVVYGVIDGGAGDDVYRVSDPLARLVELAAGGTDRVDSTVDFDLGTTANVENLTLIGTARIGLGNSGTNVLTGNFLDNRLGGAAGNDTLDGWAGNDTLRGDAGRDLVNGGEGDDSLTGGVAGDTLYGGDGDDTVWGGLDGDRLFGDAGEDVLVGGAGNDALYGGADADTFVFRAVTDSGAGAGVRDAISGFEAGLDLIDLTRIDASTILNGNQAFDFIGTGAFTSVAGQLRLITGVNSVLQGDVTGDGVADFELQFNAVASVSVNDILL